MSKDLKESTFAEYVGESKFVKTFFLIYILFIIVQDFPLQLPLGTIARSPYLFLSPIVFVVITALTHKFYFEKEIKYYLIYYIYSIVLGGYLIIYFVAFNGYNMNVYGEHLIIKLIKSSMYNLIIILTFYNLIFILRFSSLKFVEKLFKILLLVQVFVGIVQIAFPSAFDFIKTPQLEMTDRLTLLNTEPSQTFPQLFVSLLCYLCIRFYNHNKLIGTDYLIAFITFLLLILIQSKGGLVLVLICFILIMLFSKQKLKTRLKLFSLSLIFIIPIVYILLTVIIPIFLIDMEKDFGSYTSFSTRVVTILSAFNSLIIYPFGQGYSTYLLTFPYVLDNTLTDVINWSSLPVSTYEIDLMIYTGRSLTIKSGLLNETLYSGWAIIIFYIFFFRQSLKRLNMFKENRSFYIVFSLILLFIIFNYLLVTNLETSYIAFLPFALLIKLTHEKTEDYQFGLKA